MSNSSRGSFLLFAIGVVTLVTVLCFGFVRGMVLQRSAGQSNAMRLLAMQAAQMGASHAFEQILRDRINEPLTRFDGPARAVFRAHHLPMCNSREHGDPVDGRVSDLSDSSGENLLHEPQWWHRFNTDAYTDDGWDSNDIMGTSISAFKQGTDGRGRWIEPNLYGPGTPVPLVVAGDTLQLPALPVRFGDDDSMDADGSGWQDGDFSAVGVNLTRSTTTAATNAAITRDATVDVLTPLLSTSAGTRCAPLLLDANLRRLTATTRQEYLDARRTARYRLRYACEVRDLDGLLLVNPDPDLNYRDVVDPDPSSYTTRHDLARVVRAAHALPNIIRPITGLTTFFASTAPRLQHVFMGRGFATNYATNGSDYWPRSFPLSYRYTGRPEFYWFLGTQLINTNARVTPAPGMATELWAPSAPATSAIPAGGVLLTRGINVAWRHDQTGPLYSFAQVAAAVDGTDNTSGTGGAPFPAHADCEQQGNKGAPQALLWWTTPFGRGLSGEGQGAYGGAADTPWHLNLLTANPVVAAGILYANLPPGATQVRNPLKASPADPAARTFWGPLRAGSDVWNVTHSAAFARYPAPRRPAPVVVPDYRVPSALPTEDGYRFPQHVYPGPLLFNGVLPTTTVVNATTGSSTADDLGSLIDVSAQTMSVDPASRLSFVNFCSQSAGWYPALPAAPPYVGSTTLTSNSYDMAGARPQDDSIWLDIRNAFNQAMAVARHGHARYAALGYVPRSSDAFHTAAECQPMNLYEFDKLFLNCMGHDPGNPASAPPANKAWKSAIVSGNAQPPTRYTPSGNVWTSANGTPKLAEIMVPIYDEAGLASWNPSKPLPASVSYAASPRHRTQAAELAINDFRFSLLGSSPAYSRDFRPLDLNGDGFVAFSGYTPGRMTIDPAYTAPDRPASQSLNEEEIRDIFRINQDAPVLATPLWPNGAGQWATDSNGDGRLDASEFQAAGITPFCQGGNLFIGQSRFWAVTVRGELWDNVLKRQASQATLETVYMLDQAEESERAPAADPWRRYRQYSSQAIFQRWHYNLFQGLNVRAH
jgi:hypothetical protein